MAQHHPLPDLVARLRQMVFPIKNIRAFMASELDSQGEKQIPHFARDDSFCFLGEANFVAKGS
jgi:hypothetical protein